MTQEEFKEEARRLRPRLLTTARRYLVDDEAEDTVQDVLLKLWLMRNELRMPIEQLAAVLTRNFCISQLRRQHPTTAVTALNDRAEASESDERIERLMGVVATLPDLQQTILRLRHMEGMEMGQIAELTGCSEVAIRKALSRARQAVRNEYNKRYE